MTALASFTHGKRKYLLLACILGIYLAVAWSLTGTTSTEPNQEPSTSATGSTVGTDTDTSSILLDAEEGTVEPEAAGKVAAADSFDDRAATLSQEVQAPSDGSQSSRFQQYIIQNGELRIVLADTDELDTAMQTVQSIANTRGGYVVSTDMSGSDDRSRATVTIKVRAAGFTKAMEALSEIGDVEYRSAGAEDVTTEVVDINSRLRHASAVESRLLALLSEAEGVSETLTIQDRLDQVTRQIEVDKGRLAWLKEASSMSTITVTMRTDAGATPAPEQDPFEIRESLTDAAQRFVDSTAGIVIWFAGALPGLILTLAAVLTGLHIYRRRVGQETGDGEVSSDADETVDAS